MSVLNAGRTDRRLSEQVAKAPPLSPGAAWHSGRSGQASGIAPVLPPGRATVTDPGVPPGMANVVEAGEIGNVAKRFLPWSAELSPAWSGVPRGCQGSACVRRLPGRRPGVARESMGDEYRARPAGK